MTRRPVRLTTDWFTALAEELPDERTAMRPSRHDFTARDLPGILEEIALTWDAMAPFIKGRSEYRALIQSSDLGLSYRVICQLAPDGVVEVIGVEIDTAPPWMGEEPSSDV